MKDMHPVTHHERATAGNSSAADEHRPLLKVENLKKYFPLRTGFLFRSESAVRAVDGVNLEIYPGEALGLVGESGCGKSTLGRLILRLIEPTEGRIEFEGVDLTTADEDTMRRLRRDLQIVFQDPYASLNPRMTVGDIIGRPLQVHGLANGRERDEIVRDLLTRVGMRPEHATRYPHEFSGGQRQRIGVARALALRPKLIVCDEPTSALDVSVQAQILNMMRHLQREFQLTYLFISHDLGVIRHICDRIAVMYLGKIVEVASKRTLFERPLHPYTEGLLAAVPVPNPRLKREIKLLEGDIPSPASPPPGCRFHTRCPLREPICSEKEPLFIEAEPDHWIACHVRAPAGDA